VLTKLPLANQEPDYYWSIPTADLFRQINGNTTERERKRQLQEVGLTFTESNLRLSKYGKNLIEEKKKANLLSLLISQFKSPIIIIFFTSILAFFLGQTEDSLIIISIVIVSYRCHY